MNGWLQQLGRLLHGGAENSTAAASAPTRTPREWQAPEVAFGLEPCVGLLLCRDERTALVRTPIALRRALAIGLRGALAVLPAHAGSRADTIFALRSHAERCRAVCEAGLEALLDGAAETARALAWLAWAFDTPGPFALEVAIAAPACAERWASRLVARAAEPAPLVVWECNEAPGPEMRRAASEGRVLLLANEEAPGDPPAGWRARGGYHVDPSELPGLEMRRHTQWLSATAASVQALLAGGAPSGWWEVRPPTRAVRAEAASGLRALRAALGSQVIAMVPNEAGSNVMVIPPLFRPGARRPASEPVEQG